MEMLARREDGGMKVIEPNQDEAVESAEVTQREGPELHLCCCQWPAL